MAQTETPLAGHVPSVHGRHWRNSPGPGRPRLASEAAMAVLVAGVVATLGWGAFLAWGIVSVIRALIG